MTSSPREPARTVQVALPVPLRHTFTYAVPEGWRTPAPGCRVRAPFGRAAATGMVVSEAPPSELPPGLKSLRTLVDQEPLLPPEMLAFTRRLADHYLAPLGMVLRCAYPSALDPEPRTLYRLTEEGALARNAASSALREALGAGPLPRPKLAAALGAATDALLAEGLRRGWIEAEEHARAVRRRTGRDHVALLAPDGRAEALRDDESLPKPFRKVLSVLITMADKGYPEAGLAAKLARVPLFTLSEMAEAGLVELFKTAPTCLPGRPSPHALSEDQARAVAAVRGAMEQGRGGTFLLYGITGSGKTEVYLRLIEAALATGGAALYLVPEISLTSVLARRLLERLGGTVAILHSSMGEKERARQWLRARSGAARVTIGPRSALFAPLQNLKLVVVDEEHDPSYKQQDHPRYHARDMAILRGTLASIPVVLGSATPSVESYYNAAEEGKYTLLTLSERAGGALLPAVEVVDMRREYEETDGRDALSRLLASRLGEALAAGRQAVVLRNRTGFATFVLCRRCGKTLQCPDCAVSLTHHRKAGHLRCHYCGRRAAVPSLCPECGGEFLQFLGIGTERVEERIAAAFPGARVARMDRDAVRSAQEYDRLWLDFERGRVDVLVGTQMVAKGHDVHNVTLVGILSADFILGMPDFRSAERTFQLVTQAAGRAGRGAHAGTVVLQSFHPDHYAVQAAAAQDFAAFYAKDIRYRKMVGYPPFSALARIEVRHADHARVGALSSEVAAFLRAGAEGRVRVLGPSPAFVPRVEGRYRHQILLKSPTRARLRALLASLLDSPLGTRTSRELDVEVDPVSLL